MLVWFVSQSMTTRCNTSRSCCFSGSKVQCGTPNPTLWLSGRQQQEHHSWAGQLTLHRHAISLDLKVKLKKMLLLLLFELPALGQQVFCLSFLVAVLTLMIQLSHCKTEQLHCRSSFIPTHFLSTWSKYVHCDQLLIHNNQFNGNITAIIKQLMYFNEGDDAITDFRNK